MKQNLITFTKAFLFFIIWALIVGFAPILENLSPVMWRLTAEIPPLIGVVLVTICFLRFEKKTIQLNFKQDLLKNLFLGIASGTVWLGVTSILFLLFRIMKFIDINQVEMVWIWILSAFLNVIMQELLVRGYLYQMIKKEHSLLVAVVSTTLLFTCLHGGAISAGIIPTLNVVTMSLFMSLLLEYTQSLVAPIIAHAFWNIVGCIFFGAVSLAEDYPSLFHMEFSGSPILSGGEFMFEGSAIVLVVNLALCLVFFKLNQRKEKKPQPI